MSRENIKLDYLCDEEVQRLLQKFRKKVQDILEPRHHDRFLYRWLKARDFDIPKAEKMIRESFKFRKKHNFDTILTPAYSLPEVYMQHQGVTARLGFDYENSPVRLYTIGLCDCKGFLDSLTLIECLKLYIYNIESDLQALEERGTPDAKITAIIDHTDFSLKNFYHKSVMSAGSAFLKAYQDNYPEIIKVIYLINVPSYFTWLFGMFKPFLNPAILNKMRFYKEGEHRDELRSIMDPKILPAFLGGDRTDPDGNPKCHTLVDWNPKIDPSLYMKQKRQNFNEDPSMESKTVQARSFFQVPVKVDAKGSILKWKFRTKDYSIHFGLLFDIGNNESELEEILPVDQVESQLVAEENEYICEQIGTYILHFDNTYSWIKSKQLRYKVELLRGCVTQTITD